MNAPSGGATAIRESPMGPPSSRGQLVFLAMLLVYDLGMLAHVHAYQSGLDEVATSYAPVHPLLPGLGRPEPILRLGHLWWVLMLHGIGSAVPLLGILAQVASPIRRRFPDFHRWNGRLVLVTTVVFAAVPGLWMARGMLQASPALRVCVAGLAVLTALAAIQTWRKVRAGRIDDHQRWALRLLAYLHVIPVVARLYFWAVWVGFTAPGPTSSPAVMAAANALTFEIIGWMTVVSVIPLGELAAWLGRRE